MSGRLSTAHLIEKLAEELSKQQTPIPLLVDYRGIKSVAGNNAYLDRIKELGNTIFKQHRKCAAVLGISGVKKFLYGSYVRTLGSTNVMAFDDRDEALEWLANFQN